MNLHSNALSFCTTLLYQIFHQTTFRSTWKTATVISILKPQKGTSPSSSNRPLSLFSTLSKTFGRILNERLLRFFRIQHLKALEFDFHKGTSISMTLVDSGIQITEGLAQEYQFILNFLEKKRLVYRLCKTICAVSFINVVFEAAYSSNKVQN